MPDNSTTIAATFLAAKNRDLAKRVVELMGTKEVFELYAEDIVMEFPYAVSLKLTNRHVTKRDVVAYMQRIMPALQGLVIQDVTVSSVAGDPTTVFVEYEADMPTPGGNNFRQIHVDRMTFRDGKVVYLRELWDPKRIIDAGNGVFDDIPAAPK